MKFFKVLLLCAFFITSLNYSKDLILIDIKSKGNSEKTKQIIELYLSIYEKDLKEYNKVKHDFYNGSYGISYYQWMNICHERAIAVISKSEEIAFIKK